MKIKSGRSILTRLLPALFFLFSFNSCFADLPVESSCSVRYLYGYGNIVDCYAGFDSFGHYWIDRPGVIAKDGHGIIYPTRTFYPSMTIFFNTPGFFASPLGPSAGFLGHENLSFPGANYIFSWDDRANGVYCLNCNVHNVYTFQALFPSNTCINQCVADLSAAKSRIRSEGNLLLGLIFNSAGALPCNSTICLQGREALFQPLANSVPLLGFMVSSMILIRKKKQKK